MDEQNARYPYMDWDAKDLDTAFKSFKEHCDFMFGGPLKAKSEEEKCNYLMLWAGEKGRNIYSTWNLTAEEKKNLLTHYDKFKNYCKPKSNKIYSRYIFKSRTQEAEEPFEQFVTDLKLLFKECGYDETVHDDMIRDHIVFGIKSSKVREKLISEGNDLTLEKCMDIARTHELSQKQLKSMNAGEDPNVCVIKSKPRTNQRTPKYKGSSKSTREKSKHDTHAVKCMKCGYNHAEKPCPALGQKCRYCRKMNHFSKMCLARKRKHDRQRKGVNSLEGYDYDSTCSDNTDYDSCDSDLVYVKMLSDEIEIHKLSDEWTVKSIIYDNEISMQIDTGAKCNVISQSVLKQMKIKTALKGTDAKLKSYSGHTIKPIGSIRLPCYFNNNIHDIEFQVIEQNAPTILGSGTCQKVGLVQRMYKLDKPINTVDNSDIKKEYSDLFQGIGHLPGKHKIHIDSNITPVVHPPRRIPISMRDKVKNELSRMVKEGIIKKVKKPTSWVNSMVVVTKPNGSIRICIDPRDLNKAIKRQHFPLLTVEEVVSRMPNAKIFSKIDCTSSFWQLGLDRESSKLCTFNTPFGRYRYCRLPFGVKCASELYQSVMSEMIEDIEGAEVIMDDILVWGNTLEEHDQRLKKVLDKARKYNLKLSPNKCEFRKAEVTYVGHVLSEQGLKPDYEKLRAVEQMKAPENKKELQHFLGFIQYLAKFLPNMSEVSAPLRELLHKDIEWHWDSAQENSFQALKKMCINAPVLAYFDKDKPIVLSVDSSSKGMGAALMQEGKPVAYGSCALTETQQRYSQIEKETLAIVFGCRKFHQYIYGQKVTVESDHKPLQSIYRKGIHEMPVRLQNLMFQLQRYDIDIVFKPGKSMFLSDHLSRSYLDESNDNLVEEISVNEIQLLSYLSVSPEKREEIRQMTQEDREMTLLKDVTINGWPETKDKLPPELKTYWNYRDEIATIDGLMFKGLKLIIPKKLRNEMLEIIHSSHLGIVKCKSRAREVLFWPSMNSDIEEKVSKCAICAVNQPMNPKEPLIPSEVPDRPWSKIGVDIFEFKGHHYLISVDYFSKWPEVSKLDNLSTKNVIQYMKGQFSRHGLIDILVSDNGPQFANSQMRQFAKDYGFTHVTSSPGFPSSNGQIERTVRTVKNIFKKADDPYMALLDYRNSPIDADTPMSPAQILYGRRLKTKLPTATPLLKPSNTDEIRKSLKHRQQKQKHYHDRHALKSDLKPLEKGKNVVMRHENKWKHGTIERKHELPRSYVVKTSDGRKYRRNRKHLRPTESVPTHTEPEEIVVTTWDKPQQSTSNGNGKTNNGSGKALELATSQQPDRVVCIPETTEKSPYKTRSGRISKPPSRYSSV